MLLMYGIFTITLKLLAKRLAVWKWPPDPHWIDEQALKPRDENENSVGQGMARHGTFLGETCQ